MGVAELPVQCFHRGVLAAGGRAQLCWGSTREAPGTLLSVLPGCWLASQPLCWISPVAWPATAPPHLQPGCELFLVKTVSCLWLATGQELSVEMWGFVQPGVVDGVLARGSRAGLDGL